MTGAESPLTIIQHPFAFRLLDVRRVERLTPRMARVTLAGDALDGFVSAAPDDGARMFFPSDGTDTSWAPTVEGNSLVFPEGVSRPPGREYTPRRHDVTTGELDIDFVVHGGGPAADWAARAVPGWRVGISGPRRSRMLSSDIDWLLLAGDESALPSIGRRLEELPAGSRVIAIVEVPNAAEEQRLVTAADAEIIWLRRDDPTEATGAADAADAADAAGAAELLARAVRTLRFPAGTGFVWAAGEASSMRALRRHLLQERRLPADRTRTTGYWKRSVANWDHHQPLED